MVNALHVFTGDDTGLVKKVRLTAGPSALQRWGTQAAGGAVNCSCWGPTASREEFIGAGLDTGVVRFWRTVDVSTSALPAFQATEHAADAGAGVAALHTFGDAASSARAFACDRKGGVRVWTWEAASAAEVVSEAESPLASFDTASAIGVGGLGGPCVAAFDGDGSRVAVGGRDRDLAVWDVATSSVAFKAKNVPHDNLDLAVPVWVSGLHFAPSEPKVVAMCTGYVQSRLRGEVRLYDVKSGQRRPTMRAIAPMMGNCGLSAAIATGCEEGLRCVCTTPDGRYVLVGSNGGSMARLDMRMGLKYHGAYKGAAGAIRQMVVHPTLPYVACASLDRHVRLYDLEGRGEAIEKLYLKQRLSSLLFSAEVPTKAFKSGEVREGSGEGDEEDVATMLDALPAVGGEGASSGTREGEAAAGFSVDPSFGGEDEDDDNDDDSDGMDELDGTSRRGGGDGSRSRSGRKEQDEEEVDEAEGEGVVAAMLRAKKQEQDTGGKKRKATPISAAATAAAVASEDDEAPEAEGAGGAEAKPKKKKKNKVVIIS